MAFNRERLDHARALLGHKSVNDLNSSLSLSSSSEASLSPTTTPLHAKKTEFDAHDDRMAAASTLKTSALKGSMSRIMQKINEAKAKTPATPRKPRLSKEEARQRKKTGAKRNIDLDDTDGENDDDEDIDDIDEEDEDYVVDDDDIEYDSDYSGSEGESSEDSDVSTSRNESSEASEASSSSSNEEDEENKLYEKLKRQDELYGEDDELDDPQQTLIIDTALRRSFQLLDCADTNKFKHVVMALIDSVLYSSTGKRFDSSTENLADTMRTAHEYYARGFTKTLGRPTLSACFFWLHSKTRLIQTIITAHSKNTKLCEWLRCLADNSCVDDTPRFAVSSTRNRICCRTGKLCDTGFTLVDYESKKPMTTLWYDSTDEIVAIWMDVLVRFLFLPSYIRQWCEQNSIVAVESDVERRRIVEFVDDVTEIFSVFLFNHGFKEAKGQNILWPKLAKK